MTKARLIILLTLIFSVTSQLWSAEPSKKTDSGVLRHEDPNELANFRFTLPAATDLPAFGAFTVEENSVSGDMLDLARSYLGLRYRRGGKTPSGFDCSGFTSYIFDQFGYKLSSSSSAQFLQGTEVDKNEVQPGDLLFFNGRAIGKRIGHVGIAIEQNAVTGEITFIHSAINGGIRIDSTHSPYYARRFVGVRRIL